MHPSSKNCPQEIHPPKPKLFPARNPRLPLGEEGAAPRGLSSSLFSSAMQSSSEGQGCSFSRMKGNGGRYPSSHFVRTREDGLSVPYQLVDGLRSTVDQRMEHDASSSHWTQTSVANAADGAPPWTGGHVPLYTAPAYAAVVNHIPMAMNPATQQFEMSHIGTHSEIVSHTSGFGDVQSHTAANTGNLLYNSSFTRSHPPFIPIPGVQHHLQPQPQVTTISPSCDFFRNEIGGQAGLHQQNHVYHIHNNQASISALINHAQGPHDADPAEVTPETAADLHNEYHTYPMLRQEIPVNSPQSLHNEVINLDTPPRKNSQLTPEQFSRLEPVPAQLKGSDPTQLDVADTPPRDVSPSKSIAVPSGNNIRDSRNHVAKRNPRRPPSPSIDVDGDENNACRGRNRPVHEDAIDLSKESSEETRSKLKRPERLKGTEPRKKLFHIPKRPGKSDHRIADIDKSSAGYQDPLNETPRKNQGPPPRAFQMNTDATQSPRRSLRLTKKSRSVNAATGFGEHAPATTSPGDCELPLGGLPRANRGRTSDGNSYMNRKRTTTKRRRSNRANDPNPLQTGYEDRRKAGKQNLSAMRQRSAEKQNPPILQESKRRAKREEKHMSTKENPTSGAVSKKSSVKEAVNDDSDGEFYTAMKRRKAFEVSSQQSRESHPGDSPLSNTVGDGSHSEDDDIGAGGNELSSDDDAPPPPKRSPHGSRKGRGNSKKRARLEEDSTRAPRTSHGKAPIPFGTEVPNDCDDGNVVKPRGKPSNNDSQEAVERSPKDNKRRDVSMAHSSPVNLISPTSSRTTPEKVRRSKRRVRKISRAAEKTDTVCTDDSDEDFDDSRVRTRGRRKPNKSVTSSSSITHSARKALKSSREQENAQSNVNIKRKKLKKANVESGSSDGDAVSSDHTQKHDDSDAPADFPSQEQGSQPIQLKVKVVQKRKKTNPKEFPESSFKKMSPDELAIIRIAFIKRYPAPPSNMQAQGRYEAAHGTEMSAGMVQRTWETQLKPWSDRWWKLYLHFNTVVREKKLRKPRDRDPTIKEKEVKKWVDEYYQEHGDARPTPQDTTTNQETK